jgi:hypothetical protein
MNAEDAEREGKERGEEEEVGRSCEGKTETRNMDGQDVEDEEGMRETETRGKR